MRAVGEHESDRLEPPMGMNARGDATSMAGSLNSRRSNVAPSFRDRSIWGRRARSRCVASRRSLRLRKTMRDSALRWLTVSPPRWSLVRAIRRAWALGTGV